MVADKEFISKWHQYASVGSINQAGETAEQFLRYGITAVDRAFGGKGFARNNAALVGQFMQAAMANLVAIHQGDAIHGLGVKMGHISDVLYAKDFFDEGIAENLADIAEKQADIAESLDYIAASKPDNAA